MSTNIIMNTENAAIRTNTNIIVNTENAAVRTSTNTNIIVSTMRAAADIITGIRMGMPAAAGTNTAGTKRAKSARC